MSNEQFIINDIDLDVSPSDVQVMDDNWVVEDSYLRSRAVYCFRSKYAATRVVLNMPFKLVTDDNSSESKNTKDCIRLITELTAYPYCFIKNNRIESYISPTVTSRTGFMMFAVSEVTVNQDASASDIIFLELVLEYYNHGSLLEDFGFKSNLGLVQGQDDAGLSVVGVEGDIPCEDLKSSVIWNKFINTKEKLVWDNLKKEFDWNLRGFQGEVYNSNINNVYNPLLAVSIAAPLVQVKVGLSEEYVNNINKKDHKYILTTDVKEYNNGMYEDMMSNLDSQNFSNDALGNVSDDPTDTVASDAVGEINERVLSDKQKEDLKNHPGKGKVEKVIIWDNVDMKTFGMYVQSIQVKYRNKLVSHQISNFKHPVIQYMGKDPVTTNITFVSDVSNIYEEEVKPSHIYIKNIMSILDFNRQEHPECEAYNFLKIKSFGNILFGVTESLPGQSITTGSASNRNVDTNVYSFNEGNLSSFLEEIRVNKSGKRSKTKYADDSRKIIMMWLDAFIAKFKSDPNKITDADIKVFGTINDMAKSAADDIGYMYVNIKDAFDLNKDFISNLDVKEKEGGGYNYNPRGDYLHGYNYNSRSSNNYKSVATVDPIKGYEYYIRDLDKEGLHLTKTQIILQNISILKPILDLRFDLNTGKKPNLPNIVYSPNAYFDINSNICITYINNSNHLQDNSIKTPANTEDVINQIMTDADSIFYGYNIDDLNYESLVNGYNMETDLVVSQIDPFFFLTQRKLINGSELGLVYDSVYNVENMGNAYKVAEAAVEDGLTKEEIAAGNVTLNQDARDGELGINRITEELSSDDSNTIVRPGVFGFDSASTTFNKSPANQIYGKGVAKIFTKKTPMTPEVKAAVDKVLDEKKANPSLRAFIYKLAAKESNNNPTVKDNPDSGARGLYQFIKSTENYVYDMKPKDTALTNSRYLDSEGSAGFKAAIYNPEYSTRLAYKYLNYFIQHYPSSVLKSRTSDNDYVVDDVVLYSFWNNGEGGGLQISNLLKGKDNSFHVSRDHVDVRAGVIKNTSKSYRSNSGSDLDIAKSYIAQVVSEFGGELPAALNDRTNEVVAGLDGGANSTYYEGDLQSNTKRGNKLIGIPVKAKLQYVTDGDTFAVQFTSTDDKNKTEKLRIYGIDAPEVRHAQENKQTGKEEAIAGKGTNEPYGQAAKKAMQKLFEDEANTFKNKSLTIERKGFDTKHERYVARVSLPDGTDTALYLLRKGMGIVPAGFVEGDEYYKAQQEAIDHKRGIWGLAYRDFIVPRSDTIPAYTTRTQEDIDKGSNNGSRSNLDPDLNNGQKANGQQLNNFIPVKSGTSYQITGAFGKTTDPKDPKKIVDRSGMEVSVAEGTEVIAAADGIITNRENSDNRGGIGQYVQITHESGLITIYGYLGSFSKKDGDTVKYGEVIGTVGKQKKLYYELRYKEKPLNPFAMKVVPAYKKTSDVDATLTSLGLVQNQNNIDKPPSKAIEGVTKENTVYNEDRLAHAIFDNINKYSMQGLSVSLPAIRVYVTVGNENDTFFLSTLKNSNQYYELKGIKDFRLACSSDKNPVDTCTMYVANPSHLNTDAYSALNRMPVTVVDRIGTDTELMYINDRLQIKPGTKIHVRLGYGNDPNELEPVFNGSIVEVDNSRSQTLGIVCSGYGKELVNAIMAPTEPKFINDTSSNTTTSSIIGISLTNRCISHFGFKNGFVQDKINAASDNDPDAKAMSAGKLSWSNSWFFDFGENNYKSRLFLNCFTPFIERVEGEFTKYIGWLSNIRQIDDNKRGGYAFTVYRMTPWECMKQAEYRHPGTIVKPLMFDDRMTLFHGIKEQFYFYKDLSKTLQLSAAMGDKGSLETYYTKRTERMKPACNIHVATSSTNIINNGICINAEYSTAVSVTYNDNAFASPSDVATPWKEKEFTMMVDDNLMAWDVRTKMLNLSGCIGRYSAFLYGTQELKKECEKMYSGNIRLLGNPSIKAGDYIFIDDSDQRVLGMILVRECNHLFTEQHGYVTDIVPGQYVEPTCFLHSSLWTKIALAIKSLTPKMMLYSSTNYSSQTYNTVLEYLTILSRTGDALANIEESRSLSHEKVFIGISVATAAFGYCIASNVMKFVTGKRPMPIVHSLKFFDTFARIMINDAYSKELVKALAKNSPNGAKALQGVNEAYALAKAKSIAKAKEYMKTAKEWKTSQAIKDAYNAFSEGRAAKRGLLTRMGMWAGEVGLNTSKFSVVRSLSVLRGLAGTASIAVLTGGPAGILLDVVGYFALMYVMNRVEEDNLTRQPLLFYPLIKNGKPYVGGMTGVIRNSYWDSLTTEVGRTWDAVSKATSILSASSKMNGNTLISSILSSVPVSPNNKTKAIPLYATDKDGNVVTDASAAGSRVDWRNKDTQKIHNDNVAQEAKLNGDSK